MWRRIVANSVILTVCNFCTYMLCLWAYAGAFATCDIKSVRRARTVAFISLVWSEGFRILGAGSGRRGACRESSKTPRVGVVVLRTTNGGGRPGGDRLRRRRRRGARRELLALV